MHTHTPARRNFLKLSARLAALGLTGLGFGPIAIAASCPRPSPPRSPTTRRWSASTCSAATTATTSSCRSTRAKYTAYQSAARRPGAHAGAAAAADRRPGGQPVRAVQRDGRAEHRLHPGQAGDRAQHRRARAAADPRAVPAGAAGAAATSSRTPTRRCRRRPRTSNDHRRRLGRPAARRVRRQRHARRGLGVVAGDVPAEQRRRAQRDSAGRQPGPVGHELLAAVGGRRPQGRRWTRCWRWTAAIRCARRPTTRSPTACSWPRRWPAPAPPRPSTPCSPAPASARSCRRWPSSSSCARRSGRAARCSSARWAASTRTPRRTGSHQALLQQLSAAMAAFYLATEEIGLPNKVTAFTQSEFGRTMQPNGSGTDHAWGGHQFVLGGAVRGGIYGQHARVRARRARRRQQPRRVDSDDLHLAVRRHARQVVRRLAGRARGGVPEPGATSRRTDVGFML